MSKPEFEFFPVTNVGWTPCEGKVSGLYERILTQDKEKGASPRGCCASSRGTDTSLNGTMTHHFWEEVDILEGSIYDIALGKNFIAGMYACRPPGMKHGPWKTEEGCMTFDVRYF